MTDLRTSIVIDLAGNLPRNAQRYGGALNDFSRRGERDLGRLSRASETLGRGLDRIGNRYSGLLTGAAAAGTARMLVQLEERFTLIGIAADISNEQVNKLKRQIYDVASAPHIRIDPSELTSAVEDIVEKTGDLDFARKSMESLGLAISATGGRTGAAVGGLVSEFQKMGLAGDEVREALDILITQGKAGAFTLQNLASLGSRVVTAYTAMGRTGVPAIREMGAALQVIRQGTGSSEMAATAFEALLRTLSDPKKVAMLEKQGLQIFDQEAAEKGLEVMRPINELMVEIIEKSRGKKTLLGQIFDAEAVRAFNAAIGEYSRGGRVESLQKFMDVQADGSQLLTDSSRRADTASAALTNLYTAWKRFADSELTAPIQALADALNSLDKNQMETLFDAVKWAGIGLGGLILGRKLGLGRLAGGMLGRGKGGATDTVGGLAGVTPVYVVNLPGAGLGSLPGMGGSKGGLGRNARIFSRARTTAALLGGTSVSRLGMYGTAALGTAGLAVTGAGAAGYGIGSLINKQFVEGTSFGDAIGEGIARTLAFFGNDNAQAAVAAQEKYEQAMRGEVRVKIETEKGIVARTQQARSDSDALALEVETQAGMAASGAW